MQLAGRSHVPRSGQHLVELEGILPLHVAERDLGETFGEVRGQAAGHLTAEYHRAAGFVRFRARA